MGRSIYTGGMKMVSGPRAEAERGGVTGSEDRGVGPKPLYLLADSQLLFWRDDGGAFLNGMAGLADRVRPRAAYIGASNGDEAAFYEIFTGAMEGIGIGAERCRMIPSAPSAEDLAFLAGAEVVLLGGGDVERGWRTMRANGVAEAVVKRHAEGALLIGVSAGAVQLGLLGWPEGRAEGGAVFGTFGLAPFVVDAHAEKDEWAELRRVVAARGDVAGIGIPKGGGVICHPGGTVEAVRRPVYEWVARDGAAACSLVFPAGE
jgi:hypothetical protein